MADMLRRDLAAARAAWIDEKGITDDERERRQRSDFLADVNNAGEKATFYSTRHGHGRALADAGVPEKDIAASMHHASRTTTARYLHADKQTQARAIAALPDLPYPQKNVATGTDGSAPDPKFADACADACATPAHSGAESDPAAAHAGRVQTPEKQGETQRTGDTTTRPLGGIGRRDGFKIHCPPRRSPTKTGEFERPPGRLAQSLRRPDLGGTGPRSTDAEPQTAPPTPNAGPLDERMSPV